MSTEENVTFTTFKKKFWMGLGLHSSSTPLKHGRHIQYGDYLMFGLTSHSAIEEDEDWDVWRVGAEEECSGC